MRKLLGLAVVGSLLAMVTGCPPSPTSEAPPPHKTPTDKTPSPTPSPTPTPPTPAPATDKTTSGKVTKVDAEKKSVTVSADGKDTTFTTDRDTKVTIDGADKGVGDLKEGMTVDVTAKDTAASKIAVKTAAALPNPPAETTTTGKITKIDKDKKSVTVKDDKDKETTVTVGADTKITVEGAADKKIDDLKEGQSVVVKAKGDAVASIDAKAATPPSPLPDTPKPIIGKVTKAETGKITLSVDGKDKEFSVPDAAKVTIDGAEKKAADLKDLKPDDKTTATVSADKDGKVTAVDVKTK